MNRRDYLTILTAVALGGYLAVSRLRPDRQSPNSLRASRTGSTTAYGAEGYGEGGYGA